MRRIAWSSAGLIFSCGAAGETATPSAADSSGAASSTAADAGEDAHATGASTGGNDEIWGAFAAPEHGSPIYDGSRWTFGIGGAYPQGPTLDVWFDAIVFAHAPIGC